jgi:hypothetical protein
MGLEHNIKLRTGLKEIDCSALAFSALAAPPLTSKKLSQQVISQLIAGTREFESDREATELLGVVNVMTHLQNSVTPNLPVNWSNVFGVRDTLIRAFEQQKNERDPMHHRAWFVRLSVHDFFRGLRTDATEIRTMNYFDGDAAAFASYQLADEVVRKLKQRGVAAKAEALTCQRRQSTITTSLEELGFEVK